MIKSTLISIAIVLCLTDLAVAQKPFVVVASFKYSWIKTDRFDKPILDHGTLKQHTKNNQVPTYLVDSSAFDSSTMKIARKALQTAGVKKENVNSFVMQAHELEESVQSTLSKIQDLNVEDLAKVLIEKPDAVIYFASKAVHGRFLEQTQQQQANKSNLFANMTPAVLSGLFVALFLIVMLLIGVSCLLNIKTNDKFASTNLFIGKQS